MSRDQMSDEQRYDMPENQYRNCTHAQLAWAVDYLMTGGNGVASALIGLFDDTDFTTWQTYAHAETECQRLLGERWYVAYELWQMWHACMLVRHDLLGD